MEHMDEAFSQYCAVVECVPRVNAKDILASLNETNDLSAFAKEMRKKFKLTLS
jgi:hypothetical protein